ncbi:hypothetical protein [Williamsia herbipolensis]|uniref:hypothetical protein n=1 Tax=Williamsia herbipolensis TaxID=1603258 RepID=UPI000A6F4519|nr:hypothetical protein [Williamsia herbipolensis]
MIDVRAAVTERYAREMTDLDRTQFEEFVTSETDRLLTVIAQMQSQTELGVIADWRTRNGGADPDVMTLTGLYNQARMSAEETVLTGELWEGYRSPEDEPTPESTVDPDSMSGMDRWLTEWAIEATPEMVTLAERVWPGQTAQFQVWGEQLLQARAEDRLPIPDGPAHPLTAELTELVNAALARQARADAARHARR